jgi:hypothetical protein
MQLTVKCNYLLLTADFSAAKDTYFIINNGYSENFFEIAPAQV